MDEVVAQALGILDSKNAGRVQYLVNPYAPR